MKQIQRLKARLATCIYRGERCPWLQDSSCSCSKRNCAGVQGIVDNPSDDSRIFLLILLLCEPNALVFEDIVGPVQYAFSIDNLICRLTFFSDDEESPEHVCATESGEVKVASVKHIASQRLVHEYHLFLGRRVSEIECEFRAFCADAVVVGSNGELAT